MTRKKAPLDPVIKGALAGAGLIAVGFFVVSFSFSTRSGAAVGERSLPALPQEPDHIAAAGAVER